MGDDLRLNVDEEPSIVLSMREHPSDEEVDVWALGIIQMIVNIPG
jgi:hypothetical protein